MTVQRHPSESAGSTSAAPHERAYEGSELALFAHAHHWKAYWSSKALPFVGGRVLDVGAGLGATADALRRASCTSWCALEPDPDLCAATSDAVSRGLLPAHVQSRQGTLADLRADEHYDSILYIDVLEHIEDDRGELMRATRHLEPGGHLIVLAPAHQWLYTPFDQAIGHFRRYTRAGLRALRPAGLELVRLQYLDSVGMLASLGNRLLLRSSQPTRAQIRIWDDFMVPVSRLIDPLLFGRVGKSVLAVFRRTPIDSHPRAQ